MSGKTVLIANPCDAERALLSHVLTDGGFEVVSAACAKEAIENAHSREVHLILLDTFGWESPTMTTLTVLKHHARTCRIPVIVFGNPRSKEEVTEAIQKGAISWIGRKGFDLDRFVEKLKTLAEKAQSAEKTASVGPIAPAATTTNVEKIDQSIIQQLLSQAGSLPAFEFSVVDAVTTTCAKEQAVQHISGILGRDPALSLSILSAVNSKLGEKDRRTADPQEAVTQIGAKEFYRLVEAIPQLRLNLSSIWDAGYFWAHSVATARIAGTLSRMLQLATPAAAVTAGLLHDLGFYVLANMCPKQYGALFSAAVEQDSLNPLWEKSIVGAHHGEIGAWTMMHYALPPVLYDAALVHHAGGMLGQTLTPLSRLVTMVVQAADCLSQAIFPADPPMMSLANPFEEFETALQENGVNPQAIIDCSRKITAELLTEMTYLFPQSAARSFFYRSEPLQHVAYFAPGVRGMDVFRVFLEVRSRELTVLDKRTIRTMAPQVPMVVNLSQIRDPSAQIEILTSMMAARVMENRTGVVLVPAALPDRAVQSLVSSSWRLVPLPAHSGRWIRFLAAGAANPVVAAACVA